jgi:hypothetical protein
MALSRNNSSKSSATGFVFGLNDQLNVSKQAPAFERSLSVPHLPSHDERFNTGTPRPKPSRFLSASHSVRSTKTYNPRPYFRSRRIRKGTIDRPELRERDPRGIWITLIPIFGFIVGLTAIALLSWTGYSSVSNHQYCEVFIDDFSGGFNSTIWTKHVETGGYG